MGNRRMGLKRMEALLEAVDRDLDLTNSTLTNCTITTSAPVSITGTTGLRSAGGIIRHQGAEATTDDGTTVVSAANILTQIVKCTPTADRSKATDSAANLITGLGLTTDNDSFDFHFINLATDGTSAVTLTVGANVTLVGRMSIQAQDDAEDAVSEGVATFRVRRTSGTAVTIYRIG